MTRDVLRDVDVDPQTINTPFAGSHQILAFESLAESFSFRLPWQTHSLDPVLVLCTVA